MVVRQLGAIAVDCSDPSALASFYEKLTGWRVTFSTNDLVALDGDAFWLTFHRVIGYQRPSWPSLSVPKQMHLDFSVDDLDLAQAEAIDAGATLADPQPGPERWRVLFDPEGHPFCLTRWNPET